VPPSKTTVASASLQDARIAKALAGIDQARAQIAAAEAGKEAVTADLVRAHSERKRQEGLYQTHSATQQRVKPRWRRRAPVGTARESRRRSQTGSDHVA